MSNKTRKHIWPGALVLSLAIVGVLAAFIVLAGNPASTAAHSGGAAGSHCTGESEAFQNAHDALAPAAHPKCADDMDPSPTATATMPAPMAGDVMIVSSSTSGSATVELKLTIKLKRDVPVGGAFVLYLEDDYQEPDSISASDVYFVSMPKREVTGNSSRVYATQAPEIDTDSHFTADKDDIDIRVSVPDMCTNATDDCEGANGLMSGDTVTMVIQKSGGIKNPSEEGKHSVGASVLGSTDNVGGPMYKGSMVETKAGNGELVTVAKIGISDVDNSRGYEMTVTGSGFNNGTTAGVYVRANAVAEWWNSTNCAQMNMVVDPDDEMTDNTMGMGYCQSWAHLNTDVVDGNRVPATKADGSLNDRRAKVTAAVLGDGGEFEKALCERIINTGTNVGDGLVGSDDKVAVTFEVTAPTFKPGNVNYICMVDGEGRASSTDVEDFNLQPSIKVVPGSVSSGDTVNVFAQDFPYGTGGFVELKIAGQVIPNVTGSSIRADGSGEATFEVPGGLEGILRIDAKWGDINEDSKITITGGVLNVSKTDALPNETLTITGSGFGSQTCIQKSSITLDNVPVLVDDESLTVICDADGNDETTDDRERGVEVSNSGQFVATIILWPASAGSNPTLIPGTHELSVEDNTGFGSSEDITIPEPTVMVTPDVAGPRDYITIIGENWPVDNPENPSSVSIEVEVDDNPGASRARSYILFADAVGRVTQEHRVHRNVAIPSTIQVKMTHAEVAEIGSFAVPASTIEVTPGEAQPGDMISLTAGNMPVYSEVDYVEVGGTRSRDPGVNTDRDGNVQVDDVLIPGLDPGTYSVVINVKGTIAIGEVDVLAESAAAGAPAELPGAVENLGDNLVAIFYFDDVGKAWSFYDPRPEFAELNTLSELVNGEAYWILVSETAEDVVLNNKVRSLTCRGDDCWNLEVW